MIKLKKKYLSEERKECLFCLVEKINKGFVGDKKTFFEGDSFQKL